MSGASSRVREDWIEVVSTRTAETLHRAGFPMQFAQVHALEYRTFTRPWVMRLYVTLPGANPLFDRVGTAIRAGLDPEACEAAERLGGVDAVVALAQGYSP